MVELFVGQPVGNKRVVRFDVRAFFLRASFEFVVLVNARFERAQLIALPGARVMPVQQVAAGRHK
ncbi:hypothetical protein D3C83_128750 [compost metagenome]